MAARFAFRRIDEADCALIDKQSSRHAGFPQQPFETHLRRGFPAVGISGYFEIEFLRRFLNSKFLHQQERGVPVRYNVCRI